MEFSTGTLVLMMVAAAFLPRGTEANAFLRKQTGVTTQPRLEILEVLEEELGSGHGRTDEARVMELQAELSHTFAALPKNRRGNVQAASARYALHRLFVQRHAWQVRGLEPGGEGWSNNTSFADALGDTVPAKTQALFKERFGEEGASLHELAVLAALLESMVHVEVDDRLRITLRAFGENETASLSEGTASAVLHGYMASYIFGTPLAELTPERVQEHARSVAKVYLTWPDTQQFVNEWRDSVSNGATTYNFTLMSDILARVGEKYGRWQSKECSTLKSTLVNMESRPGSGRVRLSDFYGSALREGNWQFSESVDYLRQLGALDESSPSEISVIIPNYIGAPSNCVASSGYYSVCCLDDCEEIMDHLELQLGAPTASVDRIAQVLSGLPSQLPVANSTLSDALLRRLNDVAAYHEGAVPLHGRLFAQWMHHAYPRECPFPHISGTIDPMRAVDFKAKTGSRVTATKDEMRHFVTVAPSRMQADDELEDGLCSNMWTMEEELVDSSAHGAHLEAIRSNKTLEGTAALRGVMLCLAIASVMLTLAKTAMSASKAGLEQDAVAKGPVASALSSRSVTYSV